MTLDAIFAAAVRRLSPHPCDDRVYAWYRWATRGVWPVKTKS